MTYKFQADDVGINPGVCIYSVHLYMWVIKNKAIYNVDIKNNV